MATCDQSKCSSEESEQIKYVCCSLCLEDGSRTLARHYCVDCEIYYCGKCVKYHNKIPSTKLHHVNDIESKDSTDLEEEPKEREDLTVETLRCQIHQGKVIDTFCKNHNEVCCGTCAVIKHRVCSTESINEAAKDFKSSTEVNENKEALTKVLTQLKQEKDKRIENIDGLGHQKLESIEAVDKYEEKIIKRVKELAHNSRQEIRSKYEEHKTALDMDVQALDAAMTTATTYVDKLEHPDNEPALFATVKTCKIIAIDGEHLLQEMMTEGNDRKITLYIAKKLEDIVDGLDSLGGCSIKEYKATFQKNVVIKQGRESNTCVHDMCFMDSGDLLLTDFDNKKLKRFNSDLSMKGQMVLPASPVAVCIIGKQEVAVRFEDSKMIQFISVGQSMKSTYSFELGSSGYGMTYDARTQEIFACECGRVSVYSKTGNTLRTFNVGPSFYYCRQIALSDNNEDIYVTINSTGAVFAPGQSGLVILDKSGNLKIEVLLSGIKDPWPLCILPDGIYLTGSESSGVIVQVDKDGKLIGTLIDSNEKRTSTYCVAYDHERLKLAVCGNPGVISVYALSPN